MAVFAPIGRGRPYGISLLRECSQLRSALVRPVSAVSSTPGQAWVCSSAPRRTLSRTGPCTTGRPGEKQLAICTVPRGEEDFKAGSAGETGEGRPAIHGTGSAIGGDNHRANPI